MDDRIAALEARLARTEARLAELEEQLEDEAILNSIPELRESDEEYEAAMAALDQAFKEMGISGEPVGPERLQQMMIEDGVDPNSNEFSRGIIEMREE